MATVIYNGTSQAVAQYDTLTISGTAPTIGDTFSITIGGKVVTITLTTAGTAAQAIIQLLAAVQASLFPQFAEMTWTSPTATTLRPTANTAGRAFEITSFTTNGLATCAIANTQPNKGPADVADTANYSTLALPSAGDTLVVQDPSVSMLWNLDALAAISLAGFEIRTATNGQFRLPRINKSDAANPYLEYRPTNLQILMNGTTDPVINTGSNLVGVDFLNSAVTPEVQRTGTNSAEPGTYPCVIKGSALTGFINRGGLVDICPYAGDTSATVDFSNFGGTTRASSGLNITGAVLVTGGNATIGGAATPTGIRVTGGTLTVNDSVAPDNTGGLIVDGGTCNWNSSGGVTGSSNPFKVAGGASLVFSPDKARTFVPLLQIFKGGRVSDPNATVTLDNDWQPVQCRLSEVAVDFGVGRVIAMA